MNDNVYFKLNEMQWKINCVKENLILCLPNKDRRMLQSLICSMLNYYYCYKDITQREMITAALL